MISEPYKTDDGRWWINGAQGPINYDSEVEAYKAYHLLKRFYERLDTPPILPTTKLHVFKPPPVQGVREDPSLVTPPHLTPDEQVDAYEKLTKAEVARLEYEKALAGKIPLRYQLKGLLAGGIGGILLGVGTMMFRGC